MLVSGLNHLEGSNLPVGISYNAFLDGVSDQEMNCELFVFLIKFVNRK